MSGAPRQLEVDAFVAEVHALRAPRLITVVVLCGFICAIAGWTYLFSFLVPHLALYLILFDLAERRRSRPSEEGVRAFVLQATLLRVALATHACWCGLDLRAAHHLEIEGGFLILSSLMLSALQAQPSPASYFLGLAPPCLTLLFIGFVRPVFDLRLAGAIVLFLAALLTTAFRTRRAMLKSLIVQAELVEARRAAEAGAQAKSDFLANMSHELRTPLNGIVGFAGLVAEAPELTHATRRHADLVVGASTALIQIVNDVLDVSAFEAEGVRLDAQPVKLESLLASVADLLRGEAERKGLTLVFAAPTDQSPVLADASRLRQVVTNLVGNAIKFTEKGGVTLSITDDGEGALTIAVSDTGIGIAPDRQAQVFGRFAQADVSTSRRFDGTGLGLSISQAIVEAMSGTLMLRSVEGQGSTFWFTVKLPAAKEPLIDSAASSILMNGPLERWQGLRVLVADDSSVNRELFSLLLRGAAASVTAVQNGAEAVRAVKTQPFDVVFMDVQMPVMNGLEAARIICASEGSSPPIIALTANVLAAEVERCRAAGMVDHLAKPYGRQALHDMIDRWARPEPASERQRLPASA